MLSHDKYLEKFQASWNGEYELLGKYIKSDLPVLVKHNVCGREYEKPASEALRYGCKHCARELLKENLLDGGKTKSKQQFKKDLKDKYCDEYTLVGEYKGFKKKVRLRHKACDKEFLIRPTDILYNDRTCTYCNQSNGAKAIEDWLLNNRFEYVKEYSFENCIYKSKLRFDFAMFINKELKCLIEYDGAQHYKEIKHFGGLDKLEYMNKLDNIKDNYCKLNGIRLIRVPYFIKDIETYLIGEVLDDNSSLLIGTSST